MTPAEALLKAVTEVDAITAVGRGTWAKSHDGAECPSVRLPNRRTAVEWWDHLDNQQLTDEVQRYLRLTLGDGWAWWAMTKTGDAIPVTIGDDRTPAGLVRLGDHYLCRLHRVGFHQGYPNFTRAEHL